MEEWCPKQKSVSYLLLDLESRGLKGGNYALQMFLTSHVFCLENNRLRNICFHGFVSYVNKRSKQVAKLVVHSSHYMVVMKYSMFFHTGICKPMQNLLSMHSAYVAIALAITVTAFLSGLCLIFYELDYDFPILTIDF